MTAAHCICDSRERTDPKEEKIPHKDSLCKMPSSNQIRSGFNDIDIYGGHMDREILKSSENEQNSFKVTHAFAKVDGSGKIDQMKDVGVLTTDMPLFDKHILTNASPLDKPVIVPICLAAKDANFAKETIYGVGWGLMYQESPSDPTNPTNAPHYSSCMTNEVGSELWRYQACNMQQIIENNWSCEKRKSPPNMADQERAKCRELFAEGRRIIDQSQIQFMDKVDKL